MPRFITLPYPTMCVINGHAFAGGLLFSLAHDYRIMTANPKAKICLSEINLGIVIDHANLALVQSTCPPQAARDLALGIMMRSKTGLEAGVLSNLFNDITDAE